MGQHDFPGQRLIPGIDPELQLGLVPVKGQMMAGNPADLGQPNVEGGLDTLADVFAQVRAGQVGQSHPDPELLACLLQSAFDIGGTSKTP